MGRIRSFEELSTEVDNMKEKVELLDKFAEALDSRIATIIPTTMTSMTKRTQGLRAELKELKSKLFWGFIITFLIIIIFNTSFAAFKIGELKKELNNNSSEQLVNNLQSQMEFYEGQLKESSNEIAQLKDRIVFLSFLPAIYDGKIEIPENEELKEETINIITNWKDYVNLFSVGQNVPLPIGIDTNTFRCMDYRTITDITSWQYEIQELSTTNENGLRVYNYEGKNYYTVALATAYGIDLGNAYEVELENGTIFNIVHAEYKHDIRYPRKDDFGDADKNYDEENTISVIEFIYDWMSAPQKLIDDGEANRFLGDNCDIYGDGCNIKRMTYLGKVWNAI